MKIDGQETRTIWLESDASSIGVIDQTLLAAAARGSNKSAGRALLNERLLARPRTPLAEWWTRSLDISSGP